MSTSTKTRVLTFGTFDVYHIGHVNRVIRTRALGDQLYVSVSSDTFDTVEKGSSRSSQKTQA